MSKDGTHGVGDGHKWRSSAQFLEKKKEKNKTLWAQDKGIR
jgi:hypothetical protein